MDHVIGTLTRNARQQPEIQNREDELDINDNPISAKGDDETNGWPSLPDWIRSARKSNERSYARNKKKKGTTPLFRFVRLAKAHPELRTLEAQEALSRIEGILRILVPDEPKMWQSLFPESEDFVAEFIVSWEKVKVPANEGFLQGIVRKARANPRTLARSYSEGYVIFMTAAAELQLAKPNEPIPLAVEKFAELLGCDPKTISYYRALAQKDKLLSEVEKANHRLHKPSKFFVLVDPTTQDARKSDGDESERGGLDANWDSNDGDDVPF